MKQIIILFLIIFFSANTYSQEVNMSQLNADLNEEVYGLVLCGNRYYLITQKGYLMISDTTDNVWTTYYQMAYGDSTKYNPNNIIEQEDNLRSRYYYIFPFTSIKEDIDENWGFSERMFLNSFIGMDAEGNFKFFPDILEIISSAGKTNNIIMPIRK